MLILIWAVLCLHLVRSDNNYPDDPNDPGFPDDPNYSDTQYPERTDYLPYGRRVERQYLDDFNYLNSEDDLNNQIIAPYPPNRRFSYENEYDLNNSDEPSKSDRVDLKQDYTSDKNAQTRRFLPNNKNYRVVVKQKLRIRKPKKVNVNRIVRTKIKRTRPVVHKIIKSYKGDRRPGNSKIFKIYNSGKSGSKVINLTLLDTDSDSDSKSVERTIKTNKYSKSDETDESFEKGYNNLYSAKSKVKYLPTYNKLELWKKGNKVKLNQEKLNMAPVYHGSSEYNVDDSSESRHPKNMLFLSKYKTNSKDNNGKYNKIDSDYEVSGYGSSLPNQDDKKVIVPKTYEEETKITYPKYDLSGLIYFPKVRTYKKTVRENRRPNYVVSKLLNRVSPKVNTYKEEQNTVKLVPYQDSLRVGEVPEALPEYDTTRYEYQHEKKLNDDEEDSSASEEQESAEIQHQWELNSTVNDYPQEVTEFSKRLHELQQVLTQYKNKGYTSVPLTENNLLTGSIVDSPPTMPSSEIPPRESPSDDKHDSDNVFYIKNKESTPKEESINLTTLLAEYLKQNHYSYPKNSNSLRESSSNNQVDKTPYIDDTKLRSDDKVELGDQIVYINTTDIEPAEEDLVVVPIDHPPRQGALSAIESYPKTLLNQKVETGDEELYIDTTENTPRSSNFLRDSPLDEKVALGDQVIYINTTDIEPAAEELVVVSIDNNPRQKHLREIEINPKTFLDDKVKTGGEEFYKDTTENTPKNLNLLRESPSDEKVEKGDQIIYINTTDIEPAEEDLVVVPIDNHTRQEALSATESYPNDENDSSPYLNSKPTDDVNYTEGEVVTEVNGDDDLNYLQARTQPDSEEVIPDLLEELISPGLSNFLDTYKEEVEDVTYPLEEDTTEEPVLNELPETFPQKSDVREGYRQNDDYTTKGPVPFRSEFDVDQLPVTVDRQSYSQNDDYTTKGPVPLRSQLDVNQFSETNVIQSYRQNDDYTTKGPVPLRSEFDVDQFPETDVIQSYSQNDDYTTKGPVPLRSEFDVDQVPEKDVIQSYRQNDDYTTKGPVPLRSEFDVDQVPETDIIQSYRQNDDYTTKGPVPFRSEFEVDQFPETDVIQSYRQNDDYTTKGPVPLRSEFDVDRFPETDVIQSYRQNDDYTTKGPVPLRSQLDVDQFSTKTDVRQIPDVYYADKVIAIKGVPTTVIQRSKYVPNYSSVEGNVGSDVSTDKDTKLSLSLSTTSDSSTSSDTDEGSGNVEHVMHSLRSGELTQCTYNCDDDEDQSGSDEEPNLDTDTSTVKGAEFYKTTNPKRKQIFLPVTLLNVASAEESYKLPNTEGHSAEVVKLCKLAKNNLKNLRVLVSTTYGLNTDTADENNLITIVYILGKLNEARATKRPVEKLVDDFLVNLQRLAILRKLLCQNFDSEHAYDEVSEHITDVSNDIDILSLLKGYLEKTGQNLTSYYERYYRSNGTDVNVERTGKNDNTKPVNYPNLNPGRFGELRWGINPVDKELTDWKKLLNNQLQTEKPSTVAPSDIMSKLMAMNKPTNAPSVVRPQYVAPSVRPPYVAPSVRPPYVVPSVRPPYVAPTVRPPYVAPTVSPHFDVVTHVPEVLQIVHKTTPNPYTNTDYVDYATTTTLSNNVVNDIQSQYEFNNLDENVNLNSLYDTNVITESSFNQDTTPQPFENWAPTSPMHENWASTQNNDLDLNNNLNFNHNENLSPNGNFNYDIDLNHDLYPHENINHNLNVDHNVNINHDVDYNLNADFNHNVGINEGINNNVHQNQPLDLNLNEGVNHKGFDNPVDLNQQVNIPKVSITPGPFGIEGVDHAEYEELTHGLKDLQESYYDVYHAPTVKHPPDNDEWHMHSGKKFGHFNLHLNGKKYAFGGHGHGAVSPNHHQVNVNGIIHKVDLENIVKIAQYDSVDHGPVDEGIRTLLDQRDRVNEAIITELLWSEIQKLRSSHVDEHKIDKYLHIVSTKVLPFLFKGLKSCEDSKVKVAKKKFKLKLPK